MKILYFSGTKLPSQNAQSVHCMKMAEAFARLGHNVTLFARGVEGATISEIFEAYDTEESFALELSHFINIPLLSGAVRWMDLSGKIKRAEKPDLVYGADPVALAMLATSGAKIVLEAHELPDNRSKHWAFLKIKIHPNFMGIVVTSDLLKHAFLEKYPEIPGEKIFVAHDGAELMHRISNKNQATALHIKGRADAYKIGYVGSLHAGKGISLIAKLAELRPDYEFHIVGGTERHVQKYQTEYYLKNLHFYGHRNHADIPAYLEVFDSLLAPYQHQAIINTGRNISRWLSPIKIFEYMASKKPMICADLPILHEILEDGRNAVLLPPGDEFAWAAALDTLRNNPQQASELAENARQDLAQKYTWDKRAQAILNFSAEKPAIFRRAKAS